MRAAGFFMDSRKRMGISEHPKNARAIYWASMLLTKVWGDFNAWQAPGQDYIILRTNRAVSKYDNGHSVFDYRLAARLCAIRGLLRSPEKCSLRIAVYGAFNWMEVVEYVTISNCLWELAGAESMFRGVKVGKHLMMISNEITRRKVAQVLQKDELAFDSLQEIQS